MYAVIATGGKQLRVCPGDTVRVESLPGAVGEIVSLSEILFLNRDGAVETGTPTLPGVKVTARILSQGRGQKVVIFKHKPRKNYRRRNGHRQEFTELRIMDIETDAGSSEHHGS